jgi:hypothetical protein
MSEYYLTHPRWRGGSFECTKRLNNVVGLVLLEEIRTYKSNPPCHSRKSRFLQNPLPE